MPEKRCWSEIANSLFWRYLQKTRRKTTETHFLLIAKIVLNILILEKYRDSRSYLEGAHIRRRVRLNQLLLAQEYDGRGGKTPVTAGSTRCDSVVYLLCYCLDSFCQKSNNTNGQHIPNLSL